jgi:hypothetical protein
MAMTPVVARAAIDRVITGCGIVANVRRTSPFPAQGRVTAHAIAEFAIVTNLSRS